MLDLVSPKKMNVGFTYITDSGSIASIHGEIEYYINIDGNVYESFEAIINKYANNLNILKGYSTYNTLSASEISTPSFTIAADEVLTHNVMFMSYLGSLKQAFTDSIMHEMSTAMNAVGNEFSNIFVNLNIDEKLTTLINASPRGIEMKTVYIHAHMGTEIPNEFQERATQNFNDILKSFDSNIFYNEAHVGKDFSIKGNCIIDSLMNFSDNESICESIYNDLYIIAKDANITSLSITE